MTRKKIRLTAEAVGALVAYRVFGLMPVDLASALGEWIGRTIGYRLSITRRARHNLARAYPEMGSAEREDLLRRMWGNLGRTAAEFPHVHAMPVGPGERIELDGMEHVKAALAKGRGIIFFSAHCGNWEAFGRISTVMGVPLNMVYRAPNNPGTEWLFVNRGNRGAEMLPKGSKGARRTLELLRQGKVLGLLLDQKMNDGIAVPFFGRDAMTAPAVAQFALKFGCTVLPTHAVRLKGARMRVIVEPPLAVPETGDRHAAIFAMMTEINKIIEGWVRAHPDQWLWLHRRWPD
jgi:KDO2-lipid IV(A) lauroyltransferase